MDLSKTVSYIFDDPDWVTKVVVVGLVSLGTGLVVVLIGFVLVAALFGWLTQLIGNMLDGAEHPMPGWDDFGDKIQLGVNPMIAQIVYGLPIILLSCVFVIFPLMAAGGGASEDVVSAIGVGTICLMIPVFVIYAIAMSLFLTVGITQYARQRELGVFFQFGKLWGIISANMELTGQYILYAFVISLGIGVVSAIPLVGSLVAVAFQSPVFGHLMGQYAVGLESKRKRS